ncbi:hypothetical protein BH23BAC1_BH23BAC1_38480 [soil metagenome]
MNIRYNFIAVIILLLSSCESKEFQFVLPINEDLDFVIDEDDPSFSEIKLLTWQDVVGDLDIDNDVVIERVDIESIIVKTSNYDPAQTGLQNMNLTIITADNLSTPLFQNQNFNFSPGQTEIAVTDLAIQGVQKLGEVFKNYLIGINVQPVTFISSGSGMNGNLPIKFDLNVEINAAVIFSKDLDAPFFMGK